MNFPIPSKRFPSPELITQDYKNHDTAESLNDEHEYLKRCSLIPSHPTASFIFIELRRNEKSPQQCIIDRAMGG
jgi:hypothetical protein